MGVGKVGQIRGQSHLVVFGAGKLDAHEKQAGSRVVVLRSFFNVAAMLQQEPRDGMYQPQSVRA